MEPIVGIELQLSSSFQRVILDLIKDAADIDDVAWSKIGSFPNSTIQLRDGSLDQPIIVLFGGSGLRLDAEDNTTGTVTKIQIKYETGSGFPLAMSFVGSFDFATLSAAAALVPDGTDGHADFATAAFRDFVDAFGGGTGGTTVTGSNGDDVLEGMSGADLLIGGRRNDRFILAENEPGAANDIFEGGYGRKDMVTAAELDSGIVAKLNKGFIKLGESLEQKVIIKSIEGVFGTKFGDKVIGNNKDNFIMLNGGNDFVKGRGGNDLINTGKGFDTVLGGPGNDRISTGQNNDSVDGGIGDDLINGGRGDDILTGGPGADTFRFFLGDGNDRITDFKPGEDIIDFSIKEPHDIAKKVVGDDTVITITANETGVVSTIILEGVTTLADGEIL